LKNKLIVPLLLALLLVQIPFAFAQESEDVVVFGFELEKLMNLGSALLSVCLLILTAVAYRRTQSTRLLYVTAAFFLFAIKGFLISMEIWFGDWPWVDPVASFLDFGILLSFFFGIIRK
jgi:hypothetical protein